MVVSRFFITQEMGDLNGVLSAMTNGISMMLKSSAVNSTL